MTREELDALEKAELVTHCGQRVRLIDDAALPDLLRLARIGMEAKRQTSKQAGTIELMRDSICQALDDMGAEGRSVCEGTKAQLRWALGSMEDEPEDERPAMSFEKATAVLLDVGWLVDPLKEPRP